MDSTVVLEIIKWIAIIILGLVSAYFSTRESVRSEAEQAIISAEEAYKDATKAGGMKFEYAVNMIYEGLPTILKAIISKSTIENIVQNTFNLMESYVYTQFDKVAEKLTGHTSEE